MKERIFLKLTSTKFWAYVATLIVSILVIFGVNSTVTEQIGGLIVLIGNLLIYVVGNVAQKSITSVAVSTPNKATAETNLIEAAKKSADIIKESLPEIEAIDKTGAIKVIANTAEEAVKVIENPAVKDIVKTLTTQ